MRECTKVEIRFPWELLEGEGIGSWREFGGVFEMILWGLKIGEEEDKQSERDSIEEWV